MHANKWQPKIKQPSNNEPRTRSQVQTTDIPYLCVKWKSNYKHSPLKWQKPITSTAEWISAVLSSWMAKCHLHQFKTVQTFTSTSQTSISFMWSLCCTILSMWAQRITWLLRTVLKSEVNVPVWLTCKYIQQCQKHQHEISINIKDGQG